MNKVSAGLVMHRRKGGTLEFLLVHPGGPFWENKDAGVWSIPKGELKEGEDALAAARREFLEELGLPAEGPFTELPPIKQKSGKVVRAWAFEGDCNPDNIQSNTFTIEWPPRSGKQAAFPEVDRASFFDLAHARERINPAQVPLLEEVVRLTRVG